VVSESLSRKIHQKNSKKKVEQINNTNKVIAVKFKLPNPKIQNLSEVDNLYINSLKNEEINKRNINTNTLQS
jgi:multidrug efflux pump subunit AcrB